MNSERPDTHPIVPYLRDALGRRKAAASVVYVEIVRAFRQAIDEGALRHGATLPGERDLAESLDVSRASIRKAMDRLVDEGVLIRRHGARTAVADRVEKPLSSLTSFSEDMRSRGLVPGMVWLSKETGAASPGEVMALNLKLGQHVSRLHRIRTGNGNPMAIERTVIPNQFLPDPAAVTTSLYEILTQNGCRPTRALQRLRAAIAGPEDARLLQIDLGAPLLVAERRCFAASGDPVEYTETRYCGERYDFVVELKPTDASV